MPNCDISFSLVVYHSPIESIKALFKSAELALQYANDKMPVQATFYVVNNASPETSYTETLKKLLENRQSIFPNIHYVFIQAEKNLGYGTGNNLAILRAQSDYHIVINPDITLHQNALWEAIQYMEKHAHIGLIIPDVYDPSGHRTHLCRRNPTWSNLFLRRFLPARFSKWFIQKQHYYEMRDKNYDAPIENIPNPTGCFMFFRTDILKKLGGFDSRFFLYFEDSDIGRRLLMLADSIYLPQVKVTHEWTRGSHKSLKMTWLAIYSFMKYWWKWNVLKFYSKDNSLFKKVARS